MKNAIVFDLGAVVFRWQPRSLLKQVFADKAPDEGQIGLWVADIFRGFTAQSEWGQFDMGVLGIEQVAARIAARSTLSIDELESFIHAIPNHLQPIPETVALIERLNQAGHTLYYLSNMPAPFAAQLLKANDFARWFRDGIFSSDVGMIKPQADIFRLAQHRFGLDAPVFIDDSVKNVDMALELGWRAIRFDSAEQVAQELSSCYEF